MIATQSRSRGRVSIPVTPIVIALVVISSIVWGWPWLKDSLAQTYVVDSSREVGVVISHSVVVDHFTDQYRVPPGVDARVYRIETAAQGLRLGDGLYLSQDRIELRVSVWTTRQVTDTDKFALYMYRTRVAAGVDYFVEVPGRSLIGSVVGTYPASQLWGKRQEAAKKLESLWNQQLADRGLAVRETVIAAVRD